VLSPTAKAAWEALAARLDPGDREPLPTWNSWERKANALPEAHPTSTGLAPGQQSVSAARMQFGATSSIGAPKADRDRAFPDGPSQSRKPCSEVAPPADMPRPGVVDRRPESCYGDLTSAVLQLAADFDLARGHTMHSSRDSDRWFWSALCGHLCILTAIGLLAGLISFPTGW